MKSTNLFLKKKMGKKNSDYFYCIVWIGKYIRVFLHGACVHIADIAVPPRVWTAGRTDVSTVGGH